MVISLMQQLLLFIEEERKRYINDENNKFAFSLYKATRYWSFLSIISQRYMQLSLQWHQNREDFLNYNKTATKESIEQEKIALPSGGWVNWRVKKLFDEGELIETSIQLDIESFYLFGKTMLDKIANAIWSFFGNVHERGYTLTSHDDLTRHLEKYAKKKGIKLPSGLIEQANRLREIISDFRDWQIAHEKDPQRNSFSSRMTIWDEKENYLKLRIIRFHSETNREEVSSLRLDSLMIEIEKYEILITQLFRENNHLTTYRLQK